MKVLAVIPARGGSKGIRHKNVIDFNGRPLLAWSIQAALDSGVCDEVMVSTEDPNIAEIACQYGASVPFMRSAELAQDTSKIIECIVEIVQKYQDQDKHFDVLILLQPTSPLRTAVNIQDAFQLFLRHNRRSLAGVTEAKSPVFMRVLNAQSELSSIAETQYSTIRRQDLKKTYAINGAIYINNVQEVSLSLSFNDNEIGFVMPMKNSIDIDDEEDLFLAKVIGQSLYND